MRNISDNNRVQLKIINELKNLCDRRKLRFWIFGGWGIDALISKITREHTDVDLTINYCDHKLFQSIIKTYADNIIEDSEVRLLFHKYGIKCDTRFYQEMKNGDFVLDLDKNDPLVYPFPPDSFPNELNGDLLGTKIRVVSWGFHYAAKDGYCYYINILLRSKDKKDLKLIYKNLSDNKKKVLKKYFPGINRERIKGKRGDRCQKPSQTVNGLWEVN